jgi:hypothetical protein
MQILRRSIRENWGVPDIAKTEAILACYQVLTDPESSRKARMAATRVLQQADRNDLLAEKLRLVKLAQVGADTTFTLAELVRDMVHAGGVYDLRSDDDDDDD